MQRAAIRAKQCKLLEKEQFIREEFHQLTDLMKIVFEERHGTKTLFFTDEVAQCIAQYTGEAASRDGVIEWIERWVLMDFQKHPQYP